MKRIVILGGGTGGTLAANLLAKKLKTGEARITVVSASSRHLYQPGWLYVPFGRQDPRALSRPLRSLLHKRVRVAHGEGDGPGYREAPGKQDGAPGAAARPEYDYLIIATGSAHHARGRAGPGRGGHHFYTEEAALELHAALEEFQGGRIVVGVGGLPYKCPVAPLEFTFLLEEYLTQPQACATRPSCIYTFPIKPRVHHRERGRGRAAHAGSSAGCGVETFFNLEEVLPEQKMARSLEGTELTYDLLVMVPPTGAPRSCRAPHCRRAGLGQDRPRHACRGRVRQHLGARRYHRPADQQGGQHGPLRGAGRRRAVGALRTRRAADPKHAEYEGHVMCFLEAGYGKASMLDFDYSRAPRCRAEPPSSTGRRWPSTRPTGTWCRPAWFSEAP